ncbi:MAG: glycosyltransferase family 2 protein [Bacteroidota bacterium]
MKVSIITICYNSASTIEETIQSVLSQDYPDIEYIIVDGASKDNTMEIVNRYKTQIQKIISEPDKGIYDAMNKGVDSCTGDLIGILNSDDVYASAQIISHVVNKINESGTDSVYGDLIYVKREQLEKIHRYWRSGEYRRENFRKGWMPPHPAFFVKRDCYLKYGKFRTEMKTAADYELMLRFLYKEKVSSCYLPEIITKMRAGGLSNVSLKNRIQANRDDRRAWKINGLKPGPLTLIRKPLSKIFQFIKKGS